MQADSISKDNDKPETSISQKEEKDEKEVWETIVLLEGNDLAEINSTEDQDQNENTVQFNSSQLQERSARDMEIREENTEQKFDAALSGDSDFNRILSALAFEDELSDDDQQIEGYSASDEEAAWRTTDSEDSQDSSFDEADFSSLGNRVVTCLWSPKPKLKPEISTDNSNEPSTPIQFDIDGSPAKGELSESHLEESETSSSSSSDSEELNQETSLDLDDDLLETNFPTASHIVCDEGPMPVSVAALARSDEQEGGLEAPQEQSIHALRNMLDSVLPETEEPDAITQDQQDVLVNVVGPIETSSPTSSRSASPDNSLDENPPGCRSPALYGFWSPPRSRSPIRSETPSPVGSKSPSSAGSRSPWHSDSPVHSDGPQSPSPIRSRSPSPLDSRSASPVSS